MSAAAENGADETRTSENESSMILDTEKEMMMLNIDYFEQWDRVYNQYEQTEQKVTQSMQMHGIKLL